MHTTSKNRPAKVQLILIPVGVKGDRVGTNVLMGKTYTVKSTEGVKSFDISDAHLVIPPGGVLVGLYDPYSEITFKTKSMEKSKGWMVLNLEKNRMFFTQAPFYNPDLFKRAYTPMFGLSVIAIKPTERIVK